MTKPKAKTTKPKAVKPQPEQTAVPIVPETEHIIILTDEAKQVDPNFRNYKYATPEVPLTVDQIRARARIAAHGGPQCQP